MQPPVISLLTDFGTSDHYVGVMKGVILAICPEAALVDITHEIPPFGIAEAAYTLGQAWRYFPAGTVHLVVVDPGVGSARRALAAAAAGHFFVGPDNGVIPMSHGDTPLDEVRHILNDKYFRKPVSATFHGRDIFAPVAAWLARGIALAEFGPAVDDLVPHRLPEPTRTGSDDWQGSVLRVDRFGNAITNFGWDSFQRIADHAFEMTAGYCRVARFATTYSRVPEGEAFVLRGSSGFLEISINKGNAAAIWGLKAGCGVLLHIGADL